MKYLSSLAVLIIAGGVLAACDDSNTSSSSSSGTTNSSTTNTTVQATNKWVWPGTVKDPRSLVIEANLTRKNYMVVFDGSGSMADQSCNGSRSKYAEGRDAIIEFSKVVPADANLGLVIFDSNGINVSVPLGLNNRSQFVSAVNNMAIGSGTPLRSSIKLGYNALTSQGQKQLGYGTYSLVVVTDGAPSNGEGPSKIVNQIVDLTPVEIHTVGFCLSDSHELNQPGRTFYASADSPEALLEGLKEVLAEADETTVTFGN